MGDWRDFFCGDRSGARVRAQADALRVAEVVFHNVEAVMVTDARGHIERVNEAFTALTGYAPDEVVGKTPWLLRSGHHDEAFYAGMRATLVATDRWQGEIWDRHKSGAVFPKWMTIVAVRDEAGTATHMVATYVDISERKRAEARIHELAFYDVLTGLPNRSLLHERLEQAMVGSEGSDRHGALLLLDLDHFRTLNDTRGHGQGDLLLQQVAQRLKACVKSTDTVARPGGDEFAIVAVDLGTTPAQTAARAGMLGQRVLQTLREPYVLADTAYRGSASLGVTVFQGGGQSVETLLRQAELAMYQAKDGGRDMLHFFDIDLERAINERVQLEGDLRAGIGRGELVLHFQPQVVQGADGRVRVIGAEALVRWQHPRRGLLGPGAFVPLAEESGFIVELGRWVLRSACVHLARWAVHPRLRELALSVNVSAPQFLQADFVEGVLDLLRDTGAPPRQLEIELTESILAENTEAMIAAMRALQARGVRFALDDFGTGYSSLSYLQRLPIDQLKIDRSFVRDLDGDENGAAAARSIAGAITALARSLDLTAIAEGVETPAQRDALAAAGCTVWQGDLYSQPLPAAAFEAWVSDLPR